MLCECGYECVLACVSVCVVSVNMRLRCRCVCAGVCVLCLWVCSVWYLRAGVRLVCIRFFGLRDAVMCSCCVLVCSIVFVAD